MITLRGFGIGLLPAIVVALTAPPASAGQDVDGFLFDQAIVRLLPGADVQAFHAVHGTSTLVSIPLRDIYLVQLPDGVDEELFESTLEADPTTVWADLNYENESPEGRAANFFVSGPPDSNSTYVDQYAYGVLGLGAAHRWTRGAGVTIGLVDTGVDAAHPDLAGRILAGGWNFVDGNSTTDDVGNGEDDDGDGFTDEMVGHGTHIAGILAMVAPDARILPIKALEADGGGDAFQLAQAIFFAIDTGVDVLNLSLGSTYDARVVADAVDEATLSGIATVAAAGNLNREEPEEYPAREGDVLGVISVGPGDLKSPFSNFGSRVEIAAPGESILSTIPGGGYATWSGTSMATAFVSGAAALVRSVRPRAQTDKTLTRTATPIDALNPGFEELLGDGRLDVGRALFSAEALESALPTAPSLPGWVDRNASDAVQAALVYQGTMVVGGRFASVDGVAAAAVAIEDGASFAALGPGLAGEIQALAGHDGSILAGGFFTASGSTELARIARWDGVSWQPLGSGLNEGVYALATFQGDLVAAGRFTQAGGAPANHVARWDGTSWSPLGSGTNDHVLALQAYGGALVAAGWFTTAGGVPAAGIARWDGVKWSPLGSGSDGVVTTLALHQGKLVAGGDFGNIGGLKASNVAAWDGAGWSLLGPGLNGPVLSLVSFGDELAAGGLFHGTVVAPGVEIRCVAAWDQSTWRNLGSGLDGGVLALGVRPGALFAGGYFQTSGFSDAVHLASWDSGLPTGSAAASSVSTGLRLAPNRPNPFSGRTAILFEVPRESVVALTIHDVRGRTVNRLLEGPVAAGAHRVEWDGLDHAGRATGSGVYFVRLQAGGGVTVRKMQLLRTP